jgi:hypothetical protein
LEAAFAQFGQVTSCNIVHDKKSGRLKAIALLKCEMPDENEASNPIQALNVKESDGRVSAVKPANPKPSENQFPGE